MRQLTPEHTPDRVYQNAAELFLRLKGPDATVEDWDHYQTLLAESKDYQQAFAEFESVWNDLGSLESILKPTVKSETELVHQRSRQNPARWYIFNTFRRPYFAGAMAAVLVVLTLSVGLFLNYDRSGTINAIQYSTRTAESREIALKDGSLVYLGAQTQINVDYTDEERRVSLVQGEAYFQVEKNAERPFLVSAGPTTVRVIGTSFNVNYANAVIKVAVAEGIVDITHSVRDPATKEEELTLLRRLTAGQQFVVNRQEPAPQVEPVEISHPGAWREGRLIYIDAPLGDVLSDANRYYSGQITVASVDMEQMRITASFRTDEIDDMVGTIADALNLKIVNVGRNQIVFQKQQDRE